MARRNATQLAYQAIRIEGGLIPADELSRLTTLQAPEQTEQTEIHYGTPKGLKLRDEIARYWKIAQNLWADLQPLRQRQDVNAHDVTVREFLVPLLRDVLGFTDLAHGASVAASGHTYNIGCSARDGRLPLILAAHDQRLDEASERFGEHSPETGRIRRRSPFMLAQEALNASDHSLWAIVSNGLTLRILRDNPSLTRPAYVEVDLEALFTEELYADFTAFWLLAHASRFGQAGAEPGDCSWERWRGAGQEAGVRARDRLRDGVAEALRALGTGFISHRDNEALRNALQGRDGVEPLSKQAFFEELLRLVYRLIFLATVEDRGDSSTGLPLVFAPDTDKTVRERYLNGYSLTMQRSRAARRGAHDTHHDLWQALSITFDGLSRGEPALGLPALGGLFDADQCLHLTNADIENRWLLSAVFQLGYFREPTGLTRVNYRDMGPEELGSVYESLLELVPDIQNLSQPHAARLAFVGDPGDGAEVVSVQGAADKASTKGNTRKLTGSYYTPDSLVQELIKSALDPVIEQTLRANPERPVEALLDLSICDPACGSGHFLLAGARRLADEVAKLRAPGGAPTQADYRHALRDVVSRCIFGIDKNPMAIALAKTALWLEAYTPDLPLSFLDHHLQCGDALLGVLDPKVLESGIPDEAFAVLSGDDKATASALKKQNKADLKSWKSIAAGDLFTNAGFAIKADRVEHLADDSIAGIAAKREAWAQASSLAQQSVLARLADTYVSAFLAPKLPADAPRIPLSGYLWGLFTGQAAKPEVDGAARAICMSHGVFHWWLAFPQVAAKGGFSVMLGNPPWERIKLQEEEFFASRSPLVAMAKNKAERGKRIELLRQGMLLHTLYPDVEASEGLSPPNRAEMRLYEEFISARRGAEAASLFAHDSRRFPLTGVGDVNTYALFAETFLQATACHGRAGFIVPTGIATDDSTKAYFEHLAVGGHLCSMLCLENEEFVFPSVHHAFRFALLTLGGSPSTEPATLVFFARQPTQIHDNARRFTLTPAEFSLINPNTRTCPIFRSERDAELTKKLYRAAPVLIEEEVTDADGNLLKPEVNPWGLKIRQGLFHLTNDINDGVVIDGLPVGLRGRPQAVYEGKQIHQYDHRWATYVDADGKPVEVETVDVTVAQKADPAFSVRPRYWVDEREVLARIAHVPSRVAKSWLALHGAAPSFSTSVADDALADLLRALATWVAGELFGRAAGLPEEGGWPQQRVLPHVAPIEAQLKARFSQLSQALLDTGLTTKKALVEFPKWAAQNQDVHLSDAELLELATALKTANLAPALLTLLDAWMDARSPRWLMGWRDITGVEKVRTVIASIMPRVGIAYTVRVATKLDAEPKYAACLLAEFNSLIFDFAARQALGGTHLSDYVLKQLPVLPPERYMPQALDFIVPRVLELTYTADDLRAWAEALGHRGAPFPWNPERRAKLRAELDAYYARLYGLNRVELRYILDPADVMGADYPSETFRVLKEGEVRAFGEYRTRRLVLDAWDRLESGELADREAPSHDRGLVYGDHGVIRDEAEAELAGLVSALLVEHRDGMSIADIQVIVAHATTAGYAEIHLDAKDALRLDALAKDAGALMLPSALQLIPSFVHRLETCGAVRRVRKGDTFVYGTGASPLPPDVRTRPEHAELAKLMLELDARRRLALREESAPGSEAQRGRGAA
ncbi:N-6 DNA methylase [Aromatoleum toluvorans]|uniref:site-specific DNA-methyltransferase (adenine-specific) n=1 Tax=Aromatoleum toluvorans TaxID=92002 RepID=A0ABX1PS63_9RHOO|nr:N-6 DNA methylase [Aromatoleum toluvorans]NMG42288.1 N-6 DNA methylase [Aromatoleum toluvorans]